MKTDEKYEDLQFDSSINTVYRENCPACFPTHWHKYVELIAIPEDAGEIGYGVITINQQRFEMHAGDIILIWPGELHEIIENRESSMIALQFSITVFNEMKDFVRYLSLYKSCHFLSFQNVTSLNQSMFFSLKQIFRLSREESRFRNVEMLICLYEMFILLGNDLGEKLETVENTDPSKEKTIDKIQKVCQYIQDNSDSDISLETAAKAIGFSPCYLSRSFKKATTYSFVEYLMMQRVKHMQMLLSDGKLSITDAAYQAGFRSISTLNRVFKQYSGCSPSEYKKYYKASV